MTVAESLTSSAKKSNGDSSFEVMPIFRRCISSRYSYADVEGEKEKAEHDDIHSALAVRH